jgi:hypothetical protein
MDVGPSDFAFFDHPSPRNSEPLNAKTNTAQQYVRHPIFCIFRDGGWFRVRVYKGFEDSSRVMRSLKSPSGLPNAAR